MGHRLAEAASPSRMPTWRTAMTDAVTHRPGAGLAPATLSKKPYAALLVAAAVLGASSLLALMAAVLAKRPHPTVERPAGDYASYLEKDVGTGLPVALNPGFAIAVDGPGTSSRARTVRLGARIVDLEVVALARNEASDAAYYHRDPVALATVAYNSDLVVQLADSLVSTLRAVGGSVNAERLYTYVAYDGRRGATVGRELEMARMALRSAEPRFVALGNWIEAARVAALRGDREFFASWPSTTMAARAPTMAGVPADARAALAEVRTLLAAGLPADSVAVARALTRAIVALTR